MAERVCCLYRVSTTKQVGHDELNQADIPVQRKACREFAEKMGWVIVGEEQEAGVSGYKVSADDRDKLQLIKKKAEQGKFDILLVFMFDRLGRKSDETPFVVEWFVKKGIRVWSVNEGEQWFESHTDRLTNYIRYWQADGESQKTAIRTRAALGQMVQDGRFRGGSAPYGYRLVPRGILNKRKHEVYKLEIDEDEARVVRMMFNLCVGSGYGRCKIANLISGQGIQTRTGGNWHEATVGHILHNITYMGILRSGESQSEMFPELQIIDPETFDLAQKLMAERVNEYNEQRTLPRNTSGLYPVIQEMVIITCIVGAITGAGLAFCGVLERQAAGLGIFGYTAYIDTANNDISGMVWAIIWSAIAAVLAFIIVYLTYSDEPAKKAAAASGTSASAAAPASAGPSVSGKVSRISAALEGEVKALTGIDDEVFKTEVLGKGVAIEPVSGQVVAPFNGTVTNVADTLHAIGLLSEDGVELLIHVGMDTVALEGKGYMVKVNEGQTVQKGQLLLTFDMKAIQAAGYKLTTPMVVTNSDDYQVVKKIASGMVKPGDDVLCVQ